MSYIALLKKYYVPCLFGIFLLVWAWSSYHPASGENWFIENRATFIFLPIIYGFCIWYIKFSKLSFTLATIFLILHVVGSHYGYGSAPFGGMLGKILGISGNIYDKLVHFSFGFLILYPLREFFLRVSSTKGFWSYLFPFMGILGLSSIYEIFEWITVLNLDSKIAYLFIGGSDPFDTTKDMFSAGIGALLALLIVAALERFHLKEVFWKKIKNSFKRDGRTFPKEDKILHKDII